MHKLTPEEYDAYIRSKLMEDAEEIALEENFEKGKVERSVEIAKNLLFDGINVDTITRATGLTIDEVKNLQEEIIKEPKQ